MFQNSDLKIEFFELRGEKSEFFCTAEPLSSQRIVAAAYLSGYSGFLVENIHHGGHEDHEEKS
jgi:hypothetical protein